MSIDKLFNEFIKSRDKKDSSFYAYNHNAIKEAFQAGYDAGQKSKQLSNELLIKLQNELLVGKRRVSHNTIKTIIEDFYKENCSAEIITDYVIKEKITKVVSLTRKCWQAIACWNPTEPDPNFYRKLNVMMWLENIQEILKDEKVK